jgi:methionyl aminopeptidase
VNKLVKSSDEIANIRKSGEILTKVLDILVEKCKPGMTSNQLDKIAMDETKKLGGEPAFLGYQGFPGTVCVSVNNEIVHAIPNDRVLKEGDLVGIDYGVSYGGMITDAARTISLGKPSSDAQRLINGCYDALQDAIEVIKEGVLIGDVSSVIEERLRKYDLKPIYSLTGHGVGHELHEDPIIPNYGRAGRGEELVAGMTIAVEPIASTSTTDLYLAEDGWTYMTRDGSLSAQFENTLLVSKDGCEVIAS